MPWGYNLEWISAIDSNQWVVCCNYRMLGEICFRLPPQSVFVWKKSNAPRMTRPMPRLDCEFIVWSKSSKISCGRMGEFDSLVLDVPMPQAGCFATERILESGSSKAAHPCQKPIAIIEPFVKRVDADLILDPFAGVGTTGVACIRTGRRFIGIEKEEKYFNITVRRIEREWQLKCSELPFEEEAKPKQLTMEME